MGHAGTDFEIEWRSVEELMSVEATDPLLRSAAIALEAGVYTKEQLLERYEAIRKKCFAAAEEADRRPKLTELDDVMAPLAPYHADKVRPKRKRADFDARRAEVFGGEAKLPEKQPPRHLAILINNALHDLFCKYPEALLFGEDVAQKGGVYTLTKGLHKSFKNARVFNTLLDETMILGLAQGFANHRHAADARNPVSRVFPQCLRPDPRRGGVAAVFLERPVPQSDGRCASRVSAISADSAGISTTTIRSPRCATFRVWSSAVPRAATTRRRCCAR